MNNKHFELTDTIINIIKTPEGHVIDVFSNDCKLLDSMTVWDD